MSKTAIMLMPDEMCAVCTFMVIGGHFPHHLRCFNIYRDMQIRKVDAFLKEPQ